VVWHPGELSQIQTVAIYIQQQGRHQNLLTHCVPVVSTYQAVFVGFDARTGCVRRAVDQVALARISLRVLRFDSLIRNSGTVLYKPITRISTKRLNSRLTPRINENIFMQRKHSSLRQVPVVTMCTAQWQLCVTPVVTVCTASGNHMYRTLVTICTASGNYIYRQW
jgi:hypothetical protein